MFFCITFRIFLVAVLGGFVLVDFPVTATKAESTILKNNSSTDVVCEYGDHDGYWDCWDINNGKNGGENHAENHRPLIQLEKKSVKRSPAACKCTLKCSKGTNGMTCSRCTALCDIKVTSKDVNECKCNVAKTGRSKRNTITTSTESTTSSATESTTSSATESTTSSATESTTSSATESTTSSSPTPTSTPTSTSSTTPISTSSTTPISTSSTTPISTSSTTPISTSSTTPISTSPKTPISTSPTTPISTSPTTPISTSSTTPISTSPTTPSSTSPTTPISTSSTKPTSTSMVTQKVEKDECVCSAKCIPKYSPFQTPICTLTIDTLTGPSLKSKYACICSKGRKYPQDFICNCT